MREYYGDNHKPGRAFNQIVNVKQTGIVQKYLHDIDIHNIYAKILDHHIINVILTAMTHLLHHAIAQYEDLCSDPSM